MGTANTERVNIKLSPTTQNKLKKLGFFGETYEAIVLRLINQQTEKIIKQKPSEFEENL